MEQQTGNGELEWKLEITEHAARMGAMSPDLINGRSLRDGYLRGCGLQFGNLKALCAADPLFVKASQLADGRTLVGESKLVNLFILMKFFLPRLPFGHIVEFGSFRGGSAIFMATVANALSPGVKVFAFDSFAGMPEADRQRDLHFAGNFSDASFEEVRQYAADAGVKNLELVKGMFSDTIPTMLPTVGSIRLAHIDCDLFEAVAASYEGCARQMVPGGYIVFDDPLDSTCLGAFEAVETLAVRRDGLHAEQTYPHLVYRTPARG